MQLAACTTSSQRLLKNFLIKDDIDINIMNNCVFFSVFLCMHIAVICLYVYVRVCVHVVCVCVCGKELMDKRMYFYAIVLTCMHVACVGRRVIMSGRSGREGIKYSQLGALNNCIVL